MPLKRLLKYFNLLVLVLLVVAAVAVYWVAWRPLPQTSGTLRAPIGARGTIARDELGVPRVTAASIEDALFLQGFATAQDRMWQMDALRRAAAGRLSEVFGPAMLEIDRGSRLLRMERTAERHAASLQPSERSVLAAYARGVNYYLETHRNRLPFEFRLLRYEPRPWRVADCILMGLFMHRDLTTSWESDLEREKLLAAGDRDKIATLFPYALAGRVLPGSNAWAVAGRHTASGKPLVANDPHLQYSIPSIWHMVHLRAPGLNVAGVTVPGLPGVIVGHNDRIAWGCTNLGYDVQDLYIEKLDARTGRYVFRGQLEQAQPERDSILVKGRAPVEYVQWLTRHGPVISGGGRHIALRWTAHDSFAYPFIELDRARNWQEFTAALAPYTGPGQNFVYADVDGNIGYQATGRLPVRKNHAGEVPVDGSSGEYEWEEYIPFEQLPRAFNPPSGLVVTANQNPFPPDYAYRVGGDFASPYRARQIGDRLRSRGGWRAGDMAAVQTDVYSAFHDRLAREIVAVVDRKKAGGAAAEAAAVLRGWNGQMEKGIAAPMIAVLAEQHLARALEECAAPKQQAPVDLRVPPAILEDVLSRRPAAWFSDWDGAIVEAVGHAVEEGRRIQGRDLGRWDWGAYNRLLIAHPIGARLPLVARYFNVGPVAQSGSRTSVKAATRRFGASMRFVADTADWDASSLTLPTGVSGHVLSSHYKDHWDVYYEAGSLPFPFRAPKVKSTLVFVAEPRP